MNSNELTKIIMNPVRMRIVQYLITHETGTVTQINEELSDIPKASLYRHIKTLENADLLLIVQENKKRGTIEKVYKLNMVSPLGDSNPDNEHLSSMVQSVLIRIMANFQTYFQQDNIDPVKDQISVTSSTLLLSDKEFVEFMTKIGRVYNEVINNRPDGTRRPRNFTFISSPIFDCGE